MSAYTEPLLVHGSDATHLRAFIAAVVDRVRAFSVQGATRMTYEIHPVAEMFPMLSASELSEMADSIKREGLLNPCVRMGNVLIDGRNRLAACKLAGVDPTFIEYTGDSPVAFIIAANLSRRHLDKGHKIALGLEIEPHFAKEARKRMATSGPGVLDGGRTGVSATSHTRYSIPRPGRCRRGRCLASYYRPQRRSAKAILCALRRSSRANCPLPRPRRRSTFQRFDQSLRLATQGQSLDQRLVHTGGLPVGHDTPIEAFDRLADQ